MGRLNTFGGSIAPIASDPNYRHQMRPFNAFEGLPQFGGDLGGMAVQSAGSMFMRRRGFLGMGNTEQNLFDRAQALRLQGGYDEMVRNAARGDADTWTAFGAGFAALDDTSMPAGTKEFVEKMAASASRLAPTALKGGIVTPEFLDQMGGMRGSNVSMADAMFQGSQQRIDPVTGRMGLSGASMKRLNQDLWDSSFKGEKYLEGAGLSAHETGKMFTELQRSGMIGGGSALVGLGKTESGRETIDRRAEALGIKTGPDGVDIKSLSSSDKKKLGDDLEVQSALTSFDDKKVKTAIDKYGGAVKAMKEIFGGAGYPNAAVPQLMNALNTLTGGAMTQMEPDKVKNMARDTMNLAKKTGLGLEATMMLSDAANKQAEAMGLSPTFGNDILQRGLAARAAYQGLGLSETKAWGRGTQDEMMMREMGLTSAFAKSNLANQIGAARRLESLGDDDKSTFKEGSRASLWLKAVREGKKTFNAGESVDIEKGDFSRMLQNDANFKLSDAMVNRYLESTSENQAYSKSALGLGRRLQKDESLGQLIERTEAGTATAIETLGLPGSTTSSEAGLGHVMTSAALNALADMSSAEQADIPGRREGMAKAVDQHLKDMISGKLEVTHKGVKITKEQAKALQEKFSSDKLFRRSAMADLYGRTDVETQQDNAFGKTSVQNWLQSHSDAVQDRMEKNKEEAKADTEKQNEVSPKSRSGVLRKFVQAVIDAKGDEDANVGDIISEMLGGENKEMIEELMQLPAPGGARGGKGAKGKRGGMGLIDAATDRANEGEQEPAEIEISGKITLVDGDKEREGQVEAKLERQ